MEFVGPWAHEPMMMMMMMMMMMKFLRKGIENSWAQGAHETMMTTMVMMKMMMKFLRNNRHSSAKGC